MSLLVSLGTFREESETTPLVRTEVPFLLLHHRRESPLLFTEDDTEVNTEGCASRYARKREAGERDTSPSLHPPFMKDLASTEVEAEVDIFLESEEEEVGNGSKSSLVDKKDVVRKV